MGNKCGTTSNDGGSVEDPPTHSFQENMMRERREKDVFDYYEVTKMLGEGSMGSISGVKKRESKIGGSAYKPDKRKKGPFGIFTVEKKNSNLSEKSGFHRSEYALKTIQLGRVTDSLLDELRNEIDILKSLDHPNIVKAYEIYDNGRQIFIVMEMCSGGDLWARSPYSEKEGAKIVTNLLSAVSHMHHNNVVHRDLKFENIMFESKTPDAEIKVIDFGLSKKFLTDGEKYMTDGVGTIYTMAPQVLQGVYTSQADLWSVGVIAYMLLSNTKPFYHRKRRFVIDKIMRCDYNFNDPVWKDLSDEAKNFVSALIQMDPRKRLTADEALEHRWLSEEYPLSDRRPSEAFMDDIHGQLSTFGENSEFKKMALMVIAHKSSTEDIVKLRKAFDQYDSGNDGRISYEEFSEALKKFDYTDEELQQMFSNVDYHQNGVIYYTEFLAATLEAHGHIEEDRLAEAFDRIDSDDSGYISKKNLRNLLGVDYTPDRVEKLLEETDLDGDGKISFKEFMDCFRKENKSIQSQLARLETTLSEDEAELVDIDMVIPGGRHEQSEREGKPAE